jgi:hypothetical protein
MRHARNASLKCVYYFIAWLNIDNRSQAYMNDLRLLFCKLVRVMQKMPERDSSSTIGIMNTFNASLASFITDCFSIMDRGYVMSLVKAYCCLIGNDHMNTAAGGLAVRPLMCVSDICRSASSWTCSGPSATMSTTSHSTCPLPVISMPKAFHRATDFSPECCLKS